MAVGEEVGQAEEHLDRVIMTLQLNNMRDVLAMAGTVQSAAYKNAAGKLNGWVCGDVVDRDGQVAGRFAPDWDGDRSYRLFGVVGDHHETAIDAGPLSNAQVRQLLAGGRTSAKIMFIPSFSVKPEDLAKETESMAQRFAHTYDEIRGRYDNVVTKLSHFFAGLL